MLALCEKWLWLKKPVPKWNPGKWKHGPKPAVCPSCLLLSHTQSNNHDFCRGGSVRPRHLENLSAAGELGQRQVGTRSRPEPQSAPESTPKKLRRWIWFYSLWPGLVLCAGLACSSCSGLDAELKTWHLCLLPPSENSTIARWLYKWPSLMGHGIARLRPAGREAERICTSSKRNPSLGIGLQCRPVPLKRV